MDLKEVRSGKHLDIDMYAEDHLAKEAQITAIYSMHSELLSQMKI